MSQTTASRPVGPQSIVQQAEREASDVVAPLAHSVSSGTSAIQGLANQALKAAGTGSGAAVDDHAALDTLARQLYGRFSRHLAGELLIDRERAQFLTDLT